MLKILSLFFRKKEYIKASDSKSVDEIFQSIKANFNRTNLSRYDSGLYGYYFRYKMGKNKIELGFKSLMINGETQNITTALHSKMLDFFESQGKGTIREEYIF